MLNWSGKVSTAGDSSGDQSLTVETAENHVYFYSDVNDDRVLALLKELRKLDADLRTRYATMGLGYTRFPPLPIWLHVTSYGGYIHSALNLADQIGTIETPVWSVVEGMVASAGTIITMACTKRFITPRSLMLIHQLSGAVWGKHDDMQDDMKSADIQMEHMVEFYVKHSRMKRRVVRKMLRHESWFDAEECVRLGLVDEVLR